MFLFTDTATTAIYTYCHALSLHDALPIYNGAAARVGRRRDFRLTFQPPRADRYVPSPYINSDAPTDLPQGLPGDDLSEQLAGIYRSEEHTSELQSLMRISYAVFCLNNKNT